MNKKFWATAKLLDSNPSGLLADYQGDSRDYLAVCSLLEDYTYLGRGMCIEDIELLGITHERSMAVAMRLMIDGYLELSERHSVKIERTDKIL